jgi:hypothetical protein
MRRARRAEAGLTEVVARRRGGEAAWCGGAQRGTHRRERRRRLWLASRATGEDERGEGGSQSGNGDGLAVLTMGEGGGETTMAVVGNALGTTVTQSAVWTKGMKWKGVCDARVAMGAGERGSEGEESASRRPAPFSNGGGGGKGVRGWAPREGGNGEERGGPRRGGGQHGRRGNG